MAGMAEPVPLHGGDLVVFPHGDAHALLDSPEGVARPAEEIIEGRNLDNYGPVTYGGAGLPASVLCGYFEFDRGNPHPLVQALPPLILIRGADGLDFAWLQTAINFMIHETKNARPGSQAVVSRLAEVLFVQMMRAHITQSGESSGILAAISDKQIGAALQLMHGAPEKNWDLIELSRNVGMSRSGFAARFHQLVNQTPMQYLTFWRMQKARDEIVGATRFMRMNAPHRRLEIGTTFYARRVQRTPVNSETKLLLLSHAFEVMGCVCVQFRTDHFNHASQRAIERLGAKRDGLIRNHQMLDGRVRDTVLYSILANEWDGVKRNLQFKLSRR